MGGKSPRAEREKKIRTAVFTDREPVNTGSVYRPTACYAISDAGGS